MRSKRILFPSIIPMLALGMIFVLSACEDNKDLYNPERVQEEAKKAFPVKDIDPNQTWETSAVCNASVSVNEKDGETYTIKVYTSNPYNINNDDIYLLAKTTVVNGKTADFQFDIPSALQSVYVMKVNSEGYSSAKSAFVTNGNIEVSFGGANNVASVAKTRATSETGITYDIPNINDINLFPTKESVGTLTSTNGEVGSASDYEINKSVKDLNNWVSNANMYVTEDVTLNSIAIASNSRLYILPGVSLTLSGGYSLSQSGSMISIGVGATLNVTDGRLQANNATIYNLGTINANEIEASGSGHIYNIYNSTLNIDTKVNVANAASLLVNEGTIIAASFETQGSSSFYNSGTVTISGKSHLSSNDQRWENQGYFKTGTMEIEATSSKLLTACQLYVDGLFNIHTSDSPNNLFSVEGGSYVQCGSLYMDNARVSLGGKAFFNVLGTATYNYNLGGFYNTADEFALLKINKAIQNQQGNGNTIGYHGKIYVASDEHFDNGLSGSVPYIVLDGAEITGADNASITVEVTACTPVGYEGTADDGKGEDGGSVVDKPIEYAYAFEDMTKEALTDYDFNDVVLYVTAPYKKDGQNVVDVTLKAAGASKQLTVFFKDRYSGTAPVAQNIFGEKGGEVHTVFGVEPGTLVNTGIPVDTEAEIATKSPVTVTVTVTEGFLMTRDGDFYIADEKGKEVHIPNFTPGFKNGNVPYAIRVAGDTWRWPKERIGITEAYPDFEGWAKNNTTNQTWYNNPQSGNVY
ncbi:LruC domain-containing protein [Bacteroides sp.]|uniref:LruC domain-containing protein n=1 Tax=Bacteroides sp. TaxID=29523 RepID=UPI003AB1B852